MPRSSLSQALQHHSGGLIFAIEELKVAHRTVLKAIAASKMKDRITACAMCRVANCIDFLKRLELPRPIG